MSRTSSPSRTRLRLLALVAGATLGVAALPAVGSDAQATSYEVTDQASFDAAVAQAKGGDVIRLAPGVYPELRVQGRQFSAPVEITGTRDVKLDGLVIDASSNVTLTGVALTPIKNTARLKIQGGSTNVTIDRILVDGRDQLMGAFIDTGGSNVVIKNSELTNCGQNNMCVRPGAEKLLIANNNFHDCLSCDFIRGGGNGATVVGNRFDRARKGDCQGRCPHNDPMQIMGGGPWRIANNSFGEMEAGTAQIYINPGGGSAERPIHDVVIESNYFNGDNLYGIRIGTGEDSPAPPPARVRIVNNTILAGRAGGVELNKTWLEVPVAERPIVANNIFGKGGGDCPRGRYQGNLAITGAACDGGETGPANLDPKGLPTKASALVIDRAIRSYAPSEDYYGNDRSGAPDRGAFEFLGAKPKPKPTPDPKKSKDKGQEERRLDQEITIVAFKATPSKPRSGRSFALGFAVASKDGKRIEPESVSCSASIGKKNVRLIGTKVGRRDAMCEFKLPAGVSGKLVKGVVLAIAGDGLARRKFETTVS